MLEVVTIVGIVMNVASVVGVVLLNKKLASTNGFDFILLLSASHFVFTGLGVRLLLQMGLFTYKPADIKKVLPVALGSLGSVAFMNLNLAHNSVGFYQLSKLACIPVTIMIERMLYNKAASKAVQIALIPILIGVGLATVNDTEVNFAGTLFAACAVLCTTCAQIFTSRYQKELQLDALQLLYHTSPLIALGMIAMVPIFDDISSLATYEWPVDVVSLVGLTCVLALGVNITNYLVLGKTGPITYQVLGHFKTISILVLGFLFFNAHPTFKAVVGIVIAMGGVIMYSEAKRAAQPQAVTSKHVTHTKTAV